MYVIWIDNSQSTFSAVVHCCIKNALMQFTTRNSWEVWNMANHLLSPVDFLTVPAGVPDRWSLGGPEVTQHLGILYIYTIVKSRDRC